MEKLTLTVLLIEDDPGDASLIKAALGTRCVRFDVCHVGCLCDGLQRLASTPFDAVLLDLSLPDSRGTDSVKKVHELAPATPVLVLTGWDNEEAALVALENGAHDYLVKGDMASNAVGRAVMYGVQRLEMQREKELIIAELETAKRQLEAKNQRLTELYETAHRLVDNVSHEFRTPLTVIKEYCSIIQDGLAGEVNERQRQYLEIVDDRVQDLSIMVNDMLDLSRLEAGLLGVRRKTCHIDEVIRQVCEALARKALIKQVSIALEIADDLPTVYCDAEKAGRVLMNLAVNAIKFVPDGGKIRVWARASEDGADALIGVTDDGPGIGPADLERIFQRFQQAGDSARANSSGFGLGLSIAQELVHLGLGEISVESKVGQGSTFCFTVPAADPHTIVARQIERLRSLSGKTCCTPVEMRIDDDVDEKVLEDVDALLHDLLRRDDLLLRVAPRQWLMISAVEPSECAALVGRIDHEWELASRERLLGPLPRLEKIIHADTSFARAAVVTQGILAAVEVAHV